MKYGRSLQELAIELDRQAKVKKDYVATAGAMQGYFLIPRFQKVG